MKKVWLLVLLVLMFLVSPCFGVEYATPTGKIASTGQAVSVSCGVTAVGITTDGSNAATIGAYCGTNTGGILLPGFPFVCAGAAGTCGVTYETYPIACPTGVYVTVSGTGAGVNIGYVKR